MIATLEELDEDALVCILTEPKNALTKQYAKLFEMEGAEIEFREEALRAVARKAMERAGVGVGVGSPGAGGAGAPHHWLDSISRCWSTRRR